MSRTYYTWCATTKRNHDFGSSKMAAARRVFNQDPHADICIVAPMAKAADGLLQPLARQNTLVTRAIALQEDQS